MNFEASAASGGSYAWQRSSCVEIEFDSRASCRVSRGSKTRTPAINRVENRGSQRVCASGSRICARLAGCASVQHRLRGNVAHRNRYPHLAVPGSARREPGVGRRGRPSALGRQRVAAHPPLRPGDWPDVTNPDAVHGGSVGLAAGGRAVAGLAIASRRSTSPRARSSRC